MTTITAPGADAAASAPVTPIRESGTGPSHTARARRSVPSWAWLGLVPFAAYVVLFLAVPTVLAIGSGFFTKDGSFTWSNISALADPVVLTTFANSAGLSLLTAVIGAVVGALVCYALLGMNPEGAVRSAVDAAAGVLAQFGGVMLAFAFIATIGIQGVLKVLLEDSFGINIYANGTWLYELPGLVLPYIYFQVPLMVITFMPALAALKPQWAEANLTLGGTRTSFWLRIGLPVLAPSFLASLLLLFANAFSSYATAAALASQGAQIVPLQIRAALTSETVLGRENLAGALALGMIVIVGVVMALYSLIQRRAARWQS
ncbi:ABC transporter permease [Microbacterium oxydans]|uniref:Spermidine/putrescine ABC transporter membrane protein n=1 Tax=Microbacterium oxydans TaxID=82380 RepID=A0A0F0LA99_9MICO|nr:ABC transporter permease [Microbacterium oxydans]KJL29185.1 spermidine/putrescine ABC transporter membrane protein [Microbacterium oxydans]